MKKIIVACGAGLATSCAVAKMVSSFLDESGFGGQYEIIQSALSSVVEKCEGADLLIATTAAPKGVTCPYVSGVPFITGMGLSDVKRFIVQAMG